jgi:hypothetical protein
MGCPDHTSGEAAKNKPEFVHGVLPWAGRSRTTFRSVRSILARGRKVQMLPLACERHSKTWVQWTGVDTILGSLAEPGRIPKERFELRPETICRELLVEGDRIVGAKVEHLPSLQNQIILADLVVVAANAFYTPQLLWKSGIRPTALGHYLNDQPMAFCQIVLKHQLLDRIRERWPAPDPSIDPVPIPVDDPSFLVPRAPFPLPNSSRCVSL